MKRSKQKNRARYYDPVTVAQIKKIWAAARELGVADDTVYDLVEEVIRYPSVSMLSKNEARQVIARLVNPGAMHNRGGIPWTYKPVNDRGEPLPYFGHVNGIRSIVLALDWPKDGFKGWLKKYRHASGIRSMDRGQVQKTFVALRNLQKNYNRN